VLKYFLFTIGINNEFIGKLLIGNRFHVKLLILSIENCEKGLRVKNWKAKRAEKTKKLKTKIYKTEHMLKYENILTKLTDN